jgi:hypothetical protein
MQGPSRNIAPKLREERSREAGSTGLHATYGLWVGPSFQLVRRSVHVGTNVVLVLGALSEVEKLEGAIGSHQSQGYC